MLYFSTQNGEKESQCKLHNEAIWVQLKSWGCLTLSAGFLSKKFVGRSSNPPLNVGIIGKSSWQGA